MASKIDYVSDFKEMIDLIAESDFNPDVEKYLVIGYLRSIYNVVGDDEECLNLLKVMEKTLYPSDESNIPLEELFQEFKEDFYCMLRGLSI